MPAVYEFSVLETIDLIYCTRGGFRLEVHRFWRREDFVRSVSEALSGTMIEAEIVPLATVAEGSTTSACFANSSARRLGPGARAGRGSPGRFPGSNRRPDRRGPSAPARRSGGPP